MLDWVQLGLEEMGMVADFAKPYKMDDNRDKGVFLFYRVVTGVTLPKGNSELPRCVKNKWCEYAFGEMSAMEEDQCKGS